MSNKHVLRSVAMAAQIWIDQQVKYWYPVLSEEEYKREEKCRQERAIKKANVT
ncbi:hypothetical protein HUW51_00985 (plasmid) [Adhaeribacter swui]|uniref:Uncharacterized protein n=1 Tax=Adhaeribacter swui TaxID=2086471 RepID=A0A7G7G2H9_9BACT|nr:hypothetical protein [Adhaeribacter swui]QNF31363.1 hypothetical protein HUW51_00985 [Adhaeribacter swui]